jgi:hypothetical protein
VPQNHPEPLTLSLLLSQSGIHGSSFDAARGLASNQRSSPTMIEGPRLPLVMRGKIELFKLMDPPHRIRGLGIYYGVFYRHVAPFAGAAGW